MLKLCYVAEATEGGVRKHLRELIDCFAQPGEGFEIHALLGDRGEPGFGAELERWRAAGVRAEVLPELARALHPNRDWAAYRVLKRRLRHLAPQVVHTHSAKAGFLGRLAAHACGVPRIIHTPHIFPFLWSGGLASALYLGLERFAAERCHRLICVGAGQREAALRYKVAAEAKLTVIPNGVRLPPLPDRARILAERAKLGLGPDQLAIGMVARLAPQKGVGTFLKAAQRILNARADAVFVLLGGGPLESEVRSQAQALGLPRDRMRIMGHVEEAEARYPAFDVLALSSLYEGLPYVLLEALAWGVPVVATDVMGSRDVVQHGETGLLVPPQDDAALAVALERLLADAELRKRLGMAGRGTVQERFTRERFLEGHRALYRGA
ncbi:MAG: glycosyl transferase family 1 [Planctomycetota bacterium]